MNSHPPVRHTGINNAAPDPYLARSLVMKQGNKTLVLEMLGRSARYTPNHFLNHHTMRSALPVLSGRNAVITWLCFDTRAKPTLPLNYFWLYRGTHGSPLAFSEAGNATTPDGTTQVLSLSAFTIVPTSSEGRWTVRAMTLYRSHGW